MSTNLTCKAVSGRATTLAQGLVTDQDEILVLLMESATAPPKIRRSQAGPPHWPRASLPTRTRSWSY